MHRCFDEIEAVNTPIGFEPKPEDIDLEGSGVSLETLKGLLSVDTTLWKPEKSVRFIRNLSLGFQLPFWNS